MGIFVVIVVVVVVVVVDGAAADDDVDENSRWLTYLFITLQWNTFIGV